MGTVHTLTPPGPPPKAGKPVLAPHARLRVERARKFLMDLHDLARGADRAQALVLAGRAAEHAQVLLDVIDATAPLDR
jgi:hypothetical protein